MASRIDWTDEHDTTIRDGYAAGTPIRQIAATLGVSVGSVSQRARKIGATSTARTIVAATAAANRLDAAARRAALAVDLLGNVERLRTQLWRPRTYFLRLGRQGPRRRRAHHAGADTGGQAEARAGVLHADRFDRAPHEARRRRRCARGRRDARRHRGRDQGRRRPGRRPGAHVSAAVAVTSAVVAACSPGSPPGRSGTSPAAPRGWTSGPAASVPARPSPRCSRGSSTSPTPRLRRARRRPHPRVHRPQRLRAPHRRLAVRRACPARAAHRRRPHCDHPRAHRARPGPVRRPHRDGPA